jgi:hypothetical protein
MSEEPKVSELIVKGIVVGVFQENCWVIGNRRTGEGIVIDPGDQADEILAMAKDMGLNVKVIANSHAHVDHILGVREVQEKTGAKFLMHEGELSIAQSAGARSGGSIFREATTRKRWRVSWTGCWSCRMRRSFFRGICRRRKSAPSGRRTRSSWKSWRTAAAADTGHLKMSQLISPAESAGRLRSLFGNFGPFLQRVK